jgi:hypothetical protein
LPAAAESFTTLGAATSLLDAMLTGFTGKG